ncbi:MAG: ATP-binding protein [bacterium]
MLRRIAPKSLYARTLLIVVLPIFIMQAVITWLFFNRHSEEVSGNLSANISGDIALIVELWENAAGPLSHEKIKDLASEKLDIVVRFEPGGVIDNYDKRSLFSVYDLTLDRQLEAALDKPYSYNTSSWPQYVEIRVQLNDGYLVLLPFRDRVFVTNGYLFVLWMAVTTLFLGYISVTFMRNQVRSITRLAEAANAFGRGQDVPAYSPSGATEVRAAGQAFIAMRQRIKRHLRQRTDLLAGVSHDLRTPLTRMKLALAMQQDCDDIEELREDVNEMENMLDEYLSFAKDQSAEEPVLFDLCDLAREIASDCDRAGQSLTLHLPGEAQMDGRRNALKRAISNLVGNGFKYASQVSLTINKHANSIEVIIDDNGPGIDPEDYKEAFKPFSRLDDARNQNVSGVGLGLSVVRDVARASGGDVTLDKSPLSGLRAILRLPL